MLRQSSGYRRFGRREDQPDPDVRAHTLHREFKTDHRRRLQQQGNYDRRQNRNVANFKAMFNRALDYGIIEINSVIQVKQLEENNVRELVLSEEEFEVLYNYCSE